MNRIVLIGNGFDLAHDLKTSYQDFIDWYWDQRVMSFHSNTSKVSKDMLCKFTCLNDEVWSVFAFSHISTVSRPPGSKVIQYIKRHPLYYEVEEQQFFRNIIDSINTKNWVDIEEEYYKLLTLYAFEESANDKLILLNQQLQYIQNLLVEYLTSINEKEVSKNDLIYSKIYSPIKIKDIAVGSIDILKQYVEQCVERDEKWINDKIYGYASAEYAFPEDHSKLKESFEKHDNVLEVEIPRPYLLPHSVLLLNFNYTHTVQLYHNNKLGPVTNIHGTIEEPKSVIFGYGDELDERYNKIKETDNDECRRNIKSIKYLESANYRGILSFMESAPYQIYIMGHSCGKSDRTHLNTLFEHKHCISIKPFYYKKEDGTDNYLELAQNISRNFTDMKLMRDRVVNKTYCETITR